MTGKEVLLTMAEASAQLRISRASMYRLRKSGDLPITLIGGKKLVKQSDIDELVKRAQRTT